MLEATAADESYKTLSFLEEIVITAAGEPVSTAFVESTINEVIARRMTKEQQMQ